MAKKFEGVTAAQVKVLHTTGGHAWPVAGLQEETNGYLVTEPRQVVAKLNADLGRPSVPFVESRNYFENAEGAQICYSTTWQKTRTPERFSNKPKYPRVSKHRQTRPRRVSALRAP